jgi:hypothetical protein
MGFLPRKHRASAPRDIAVFGGMIASITPREFTKA